MFPGTKTIVLFKAKGKVFYFHSPNKPNMSASKKRMRFTAGITVG
jgi:hypothetical protein